MSLLAISAIAFLSTGVVLLILGRTRLGTLIVDRPNARSLHTHARPKWGGLAIVFTTVMVVTVLPGVPRPLVWGAGFLCIVSALDDMRNIPVAIRLSCHLVAALLLVLIIPVAPVAVAVLAVLTIVWMTNLYNFMDGADGLAGGMAVIGFGSLAIAAMNAPDLSAWCAAIGSAALAFLLFNFPPAKLFMGDSGAIPLGFLAAGVGYWGFAAGVWPYWYPALVFSPFIFDASFTLVRRLLLGKKPWVAHREHLYQRLIIAGWSHRQLALSAYAMMLAMNAGAFAALSQPEAAQMVIIVILFGSLVGVYFLADRYLRRADS